MMQYPPRFPPGKEQRDMTFAERLRILRDAAGLSEARLAKASGVSFGALHDYGQGRRLPSFVAVARISRVLGTSCDAFADCDEVLVDEEIAVEPPRPRGRPRKASTEANGQSATAAKKGKGKGKK
jgi:transcriptional regulator with XRE-family HTH domain